MGTIFAEVAVVLPVIGTYYYRVPTDLRREVAVGRQVLVPFGRRRLTGYVLRLEEQLPTTMDAAIRDVLQVSSEECYFAEAHLPFYRWLSKYYLAPLGEVIRSALPRGTSTSTRRAAFVPEAGLRSLRQSTSTAEEAAVLSLLREHPGLTLTQIRRRLPKHSVDRVCRTLARKHLIVWEDQQQEPRIKPRNLKVVRGLHHLGTSSLSEEQLKPKEKEILKLLEDGPRLLRDLNRMVGNGSYWIRRMANLGLVSVSLEEVYRDPVGPLPVIRSKRLELSPRPLKRTVSPVFCSTE
jgi:primosomal protein N' (replication factor Y)